MSIQTVVFDVGETLVDETRMWGLHADRLGVSHLTFFAALGAVIERGLHHRAVFDLFGPPAADIGYRIEARDLYPDAASCLTGLKASGYKIGIAGNQPEAAEAALASLNIDADFIASSARWGVEKPSPAFFDRVVDAAGCPASEIAYVGDRLDNDVLPAQAAGMAGVFLIRGPWGVLHAQSADADRADVKIDGLDKLAVAIENLR